MAGVGVIAGGVLSVLSNVAGIFVKREERKDKANERAHEAKRWEHEERLFKLTSEQTKSETQQKVLLEDVRGSWKGLEVSHQAQAVLADNTFKWANSVVTLMRPFVTVLLLAVTLWSGFEAVNFALASETLKEVDSVDKIRKLHSLLTENQALAVIYTLTETTVTWWFGDRSFKRSTQNSNRGLRISTAGSDLPGGALNE